MAKFHYYGAQGRGQQIRWALAEGQIDWTDEKASFPPDAETKAKWVALGGNLTSNVPMLEIDGKCYTQSSAVLRMVGRKAGLMPTDPDLLYEVDNLIAAVDDYRTAAYGVIFGNREPEAVAAFKAKQTTHFKNFERLLADRNFFVGDSLTVADLTAFDVFNNFGFNMIPSAKAEFPKLVAFMESIAARPNIAAYMQSEKYTSLIAFPCVEVADPAA